MRYEARQLPGGSSTSRSTFDRPLPGLVDDLATKAVTRTPSQWRAAALVALVGLAGLVVALIVVGEAIVHLGALSGLRAADDQFSADLAAHRTGGWNTFSAFWSHSAETLPIVVGGVLVEIVLAVRKQWRDLLVVVIGLTVELTTFLVVNEVVRRPRPSVDKLGIVPLTFSYPSGHTAATIVLYGSIVLLITLRLRSRLARVLPWVLVLAITAAVGYARVYRGMHHLSDVVTGTIMGVAALAVAVTATRASSIAAHPATDASTDDALPDDAMADQAPRSLTSHMAPRAEEVPT